MKIITITCSKCKYKKKMEEEYIDMEESCPICQSKMTIADKDMQKMKKIQGEKMMELLIEDIMIGRMKKQIKKLGNKKAMEVIERYTNPTARARLRIIFFKAGGKNETI